MSLSKYYEQQPYGGIYPHEIKTLQNDYAALWGPLSDLLKQLAAIVEM